MENKLYKRLVEVVQASSEKFGLIFSGKKAVQTLKENEIKYRLLFENARDAIFVSDAKEMHIVDANKEACELMGYTHEELLEKTVFDLHPVELRNSIFQDFSDRVIKTKNDLFETVIINREGRRVPVEMSSAQMYNLRGRQVLAAFFRDITDRKNAEAVLKSSEEKYRFLTENAYDVIWVFNLTNNKFTYISPSIIHLTGFTAEEAMNQSLEASIVPESLAMLKAAMERNINAFIENPQSPICDIIEVQQPCKNGAIIWVEISIKYRYNSDKAIETVCVSRNIEDRKKTEKQVLYLSYHDQLTGLYNRRFYEEELITLNRKSNLPMTLVMADVNGLKLTNDVFGHKAGDILLKKIAKILKMQCCKDEIVARIGGDEFVLLLPRTDVEEAENVIRRVNEAIARHKIYNIVLSISIGFAVKQEVSEDMNEIFKKAEDDMYRHKLSESSSMRSKTIDLIMNSLYAKSNREMLHSKRVSGICEAIATKMNFAKEDIDQLKIAGLMHDIGKIGINDTILNKVEKLNSDEWEEIMRHSEVGYRILSSVREFSKISDYVLEHHERWKGQGYPKGLKGENISLQARIIAVADTYDAMTSDRPYRIALSKKEAIEEIRKYSGVQFDPDIVKVFDEKVLGNLG